MFRLNYIKHREDILLICFSEQLKNIAQVGNNIWHYWISHWINISFHFNHALHKGCPSSGFFLTHFWFSPNMGKYGSEKTPHSDTFHAVTLLMNRVLPFLWGKVKVKGCLLQYWMKYLGKSKKKQGKWNRTRKLWYLLWCSFWPILWKVSFWKRNCALNYGSIFIFRLHDIPDLLRFLSRSATRGGRTTLLVSIQTHIKIFQFSKTLCTWL